MSHNRGGHSLDTWTILFPWEAASPQNGKNGEGGYLAGSYQDHSDMQPCTAKHIPCCPLHTQMLPQNQPTLQDPTLPQG